MKHLSKEKKHIIKVLAVVISFHQAASLLTRIFVVKLIQKNIFHNSFFKNEFECLVSEKTL